MQRPGSVLAMFFLGLVLGTPARVATATELGTRGTRFTIDGTPRFLLGISAVQRPRRTGRVVATRPR